MAEAPVLQCFDSALNDCIFHQNWPLAFALIRDPVTDTKSAYSLNGSVAIHFASQSGNVALVQALMDRGESVLECNKDGLSCLFWAIAGYDRLQRDQQCISYAREHREEMVSFLIKERVPFDRRCLQRAIISGDVAVTKCLLQLGSPTEFATPTPWHALFDCVRLNQPSVCETMCRNAKFINLEAESFRGGTPFAFAASLYSLDCMSVLARHGANLEPKNTYSGLTAMEEMKRFENPSSKKVADFITSLLEDRAILTCEYQENVRQVLVNACIENISSDVAGVVCSFLPLYLYKE